MKTTVTHLRTQSCLSASDVTHLSLYVGRGSTGGGANLGRFAEHLLLLQGHGVLAGSVTIFLVVEDGIGVVDQQLVLLCRGEQLSGEMCRDTANSIIDA